ARADRARPRGLSAPRRRRPRQLREPRTLLWCRRAGDPPRARRPRALARTAEARRCSAPRRVRRPRSGGARTRARPRRPRRTARPRVEFAGLEVAAPEREPDLVALDEALERLAEVDSAKARLVELRFFAGMTLDEAAQTLGVSPSTVVRDWRMARAWLQSAL